MEENYNYNYEAQQPVAEEKPARNLKKILIPVIAVIVVLAIAIPLICGLVFNTYKTPLKLEVAEKNAKTFNAYTKASMKLTNGILNKEIKALYNILSSSEEYDKEELKENFEEGLEAVKEQYGSNFKYYYEIEDKEKIDKDDLKEIKEEIRDSAKAALENLKDIDDEYYEEMADYMGISESKAKKLVKTAESAYKKLKAVKVTAGYELEAKLMVKGSELDEPEEIWSGTIIVCKVNGKWVDISNLDFDII